MNKMTREGKNENGVSLQLGYFDSIHVRCARKWRLMNLMKNSFVTLPKADAKGNFSSKPMVISYRFC